MKLTVKECKKLGGCESAIEYYSQQPERDLIKVLQMSMQKKHIDAVRKIYNENIFSWSLWIIPRKLKTQKDKVTFAVFCAEQVLPIFESKYPNDNRPRKAIEAAKKYANNPSEENAAAAAVAAEAARYAAREAAVAADAMAAAWAAAWAACYATAAAREAAVAADDKTKIQKKIIRYGIKLLKGAEQ